MLQTSIHDSNEQHDNKEVAPINIQETKIVVTGDICINTLVWNASPKGNENYNWQKNTLYTMAKQGDALLLAEMTAMATGKPVIAPNIPKGRSHFSSRFLHSFTKIAPFPASAETANNKEATIYRINQLMGFTGKAKKTPELLPIANDTVNADFVLIDDENNGFNNDEQFWPLAIKDKNKNPIIIYKMNNFGEESPLWKHLSQRQRKNTIVVINADNLRSKGVNISKSLSWDRTALDFIWQRNNSPSLSFLSECNHLIVLFGIEGAIYYRDEDVPEAYLYFLPFECEGDFTRNKIGNMYGITSAFVAGLTAVIAEAEKVELFSQIGQGIREGMLAIRNHFYFGFGKNPNQGRFPNPLTFMRNTNDTAFLEYIQDVKIPLSLTRRQQESWYILQGKSSASISQMAFDLVKNGDDTVLKHIPVGRFGKLKTVDRVEIESYRSIHNLITEYISSKNASRPLSIAIFGTPGSGKSYGITEMTTSAFPEDIKKLSFNLSQFRSPLELQTAFHRISDMHLLGKIPLVVFDEFDSNSEGTLGWLKYFLSPMQDGVYRVEESLHPIGKAIFAFVGGTSSSFAEFCGETIENEEAKDTFSKEFKSNKGPDFISRLRGYINILGPNQYDDNDQLFMLRRAMLLRSLIEQKLPHLIDKNGTAQIDNGVLRALLKIPRYKHESRSVEAIMDMSILTQATKWEQSFLPPKEQLRLHVDEKQFVRYMMYDVIFSEKIDILAQLIREKLNALNDAILVPGDNPIFSWGKLDIRLKDFFRAHVKNIPEALLRIQYDVTYIDEITENPLFSERELKALTRFEYKRRKNERLTKDPKENPVNDLSKEESELQIRQMINVWTEALYESKFKLEPLKYANSK
jgi:hypothetical protein